MSMPTEPVIESYIETYIDNRPISWVDGKDLAALSVCSTKHWRNTGVFSMTHVIRTYIADVEYTFVADDDFSDRAFSVDTK